MPAGSGGAQLRTTRHFASIVDNQEVSARCRQYGPPDSSILSAIGQTNAKGRIKALKGPSARVNVAARPARAVALEVVGNKRPAALLGVQHLRRAITCRHVEKINKGATSHIYFTRLR